MSFLLEPCIFCWKSYKSLLETMSIFVGTTLLFCWNHGFCFNRRRPFCVYLLQPTTLLQAASDLATGRGKMQGTAATNGDLLHGGRWLLATRRGGRRDLDGGGGFQGLLHARARRRTNYALTNRMRSNRSRRSHRTLGSGPAESLGRCASA